MCLSPLSGRDFPFHRPLIIRMQPCSTNPILESHELQSYSLLLRIPVLALLLDITELKPSVTICLQRCLLTNQLFPLVTTHWRRAVYSVSNQGVWRSNTLRDRSSWRGRSWRMVSSSRKAILKMVKQGLSCLKIEVIFVGLQPRIVVKSSLNIEKKWIYDKTSESIVNLPWKFLSGLFPKRSSWKVSL